MTKEQVQRGQNYLRVIDRLSNTLENLKRTDVHHLRITLTNYQSYDEVHHCLEDDDIESLKAFLIKKLELNLAHYQNEFENL